MPTDLSPLAAKLKRLEKKKETLFLRVQQLYDLTSKLDQDKYKDTFLIKCCNLDKTISDFSAIVDEINEISLQISSDYEPSYESLTAIDDLYCHIITTKENIVAERNSRLNKSSETGYGDAEAAKPNPRVQSASSSSMLSVGPRFNMVIPPLEIKKFSGEDISDWPRFKNLFNSLIINDKFYTSVHKSHVLHSLLKEPASRVVQAFQASANFDLAWQTLCKRYESDRILANHYVQQILKHHNPPSKPSLQSLQDFLTKVGDNITSLKSLGVVDLADYLLFSLSIRQLDLQSRQDFELEVADEAFPSCNKLIEFVNRRCRMFELSFSDVPTTSTEVSKNYYKPSKPNLNFKRIVLSTQAESCPTKTVASVKVKKDVCSLCSNSQHSLFRCPVFLKMDPKERNAHVLSIRGCFLCLAKNHMLSECNSKILCFCNRKHNRLLHYPRKNECLQGSSERANLSPQVNLGLNKSKINTGSNLPDIKNESENSNLSLTTSAAHSSQPAHLKQDVDTTVNRLVLLGTAIAQIKNKFDKFINIRLIVDSGSTASFLSENLAHRLGLVVSKDIKTFSGLNCSKVGHTSGVVSCILKPVSSNTPLLKTKAYVVNKIVGKLPSFPLCNSLKNKLSKLKLADPSFHEPGDVDFLLGSELFCKILSEHQNCSSKFPFVLSTIFGDIIIGEIPNIFSNFSADNSLVTLTTFSDSDRSLSDLVHKFWESEEISTVKPLNPEDEFCEKYFTETFRRDSQGRYIVKLPFSVDFKNLVFPQARDVALQRFYSLERRMSRDLKLRSDCISFMSEYQSLGHMELAKEPGKYFIPYFCVFNPASPTTKVRVVFDGSAKRSHLSLNEVLHSGPKLLKDIDEVVTKFRLHKLVFSCDVTKMFRAILLDEEDRQFLHILYRDDPSKPLKEFELKTVTYGLKPSTFLAQRSLIQLARDEGDKFPLGATVLLNDIFLDDILTGSDTIEGLIKIKTELCSILNKAGITLNKWSSNSGEFLNKLRLESEAQPLHISDEPGVSVKVLGIEWNPSNDSFRFRIKMPSSENKTTKRSVLSTIARLYDPLGFAAPVVFKMKCFLQDLWKSQLDWDTELPLPMEQAWKSLINNLPLLGSINVPRCIFQTSAISSQVLGFCDASERGFCACLYLRVIFSEFKVKVFLIKAKTKVAPLKVLSIPRLELQGAVLLSRLYTSIKPVLTCINPQSVFLFSDSSIVLAWLRKPPYLLQTFVANRVVKILESTELSMWLHLSSEFNIADLGSRGSSPEEFYKCDYWFNGPAWCQDPITAWPVSRDPPVLLEDLPDTKQSCAKIVLCTSVVSSIIPISRFSSYLKLLRVCAYVLRFVNNCLSSFKSDLERFSGPITGKELKGALKLCVRVVQESHFREELALLTKGKSCDLRFQRLSAFLDSDGLIRVGGRLVNSALGYDVKHPYLLPKRTHFNNILIEYYHRIYLHAGPRTVRALIQRSFWIISAHSVIRSVIYQCVRCRKFTVQPPSPIMGNLPSSRVVPSRPFSNVCVDFAGPFILKESLRKKAATYKAYFALFVCMATKACHIEAVTSLSAEAFIAALQRFTSRRGLPTDVFCDQGTNFKGSSRQLKEIVQFLRSTSNQDKIVSSLACCNIQFHFNIAHAPFMNGLSESNIKNVKFHLFREVGDRVLVLIEFITLINKIEAILNSRPLYPVSSSPDDYSALTPGHFLIGAPLLALPEMAVTDLKENRLSRWQNINRITQRLWKRWETEYLHTLQQKNKWFKGDTNLQTGQLVWIREDNSSPLSYPLGRIKSVHVGSDGVVRSVVVSTSSGDYERPVRKLTPLLPP